MQEIERKLAPVLAQHSNTIQLDQKLFRRIEDLYERREKLKLDDEQARVAGADLHDVRARGCAVVSAKARKRVAEINTRLAELVTQFGQNVLADEQSWRLALEGEADLAGLPQGVRDAAARTAADLKLPASHVITLSRSSVEPFLQFSARRDLREEAFKAWIRRGENGGKTDNRKIVAEIVQLRAELAKLMGYRTFAEYSLDDTMAKTPDAVRGLLNQVWSAAVERVGEEREALTALARKEGGNYDLEAWDWRYFAEKERKARYDLDESEVRPYLQLENMIDAAFDTASRLFGLKFKELKDAPRYHPDVRVWEVTTKAGEHGRRVPRRLLSRGRRSGRARGCRAFRAQHKLRQGLEADHRQRAELRARGGGPADAALHRRCAHAVPRVRARAARAAVGRDLSVALGHERDARFRRAAVAALRALADAAGSAEEIRDASQDRQADAGQPDQAHSGVAHLQSGVRDGRSMWRRRWSTWTCTRWRRRTGWTSSDFENDDAGAARHAARRS